MHQIRFPLGLCPRPGSGSLQRSPDVIAGFKGPSSKGRGMKGEREGKKGRKKERGERGKRSPCHDFTIWPLAIIASSNYS